LSSEAKISAKLLFYVRVPPNFKAPVAIPFAEAILASTYALLTIDVASSPTLAVVQFVNVLPESSAGISALVRRPPSTDVTLPYLSTEIFLTIYDTVVPLVVNSVNSNEIVFPAIPIVIPLTYSATMSIGVAVPAVL
jgi:hypothetical protein